MTTEVENIELGMMTVALGSAIGYGEVEEAKRIQKLMMDWIKASDDQRRTLYHAFRNEGAPTAGLESS